MTPLTERLFTVTRRMPGWSMSDTRLRAMVWALTEAWAASGLGKVGLGPLPR